MLASKDQEANFTNYLSLLSRTKYVKSRPTTRTNKTKVRDLLAAGFSGHHSLILFLLIATVIRNISGPAIVFSLLFATIIGLLSGICYAEFGSRFQRHGSSYLYTYSSIGELIAFFTAWSVLFAYLISVALIGRGISEYIDSLVGGVINKFNERLFGTISTPILGSSLDILAFILVNCIAVGFTGLIRDHGTFTHIITRILNILNLLITVFIIVIGFIHIDVTSWSSPAKFLPYGSHGVLVATAICFSIYFVFEAMISIDGNTPSLFSPHATTLGIFTYIPMVFLANIALAIIITFMVPYYKLSSHAQLVSVFTILELKWAKYMVAILGFSMMLCAMMEFIFRMGSLVNNLAHDKLLPSFCKDKDCRNVHVTSFSMPSCFAAFLALLFDTSQLIDTLPIGPLLSTVCIASGVLLVRYTPGVESVLDDENICPCAGCFSCKKINNRKYNKLYSYDDNKNPIDVKEPSVFTYRVAFTANIVLILCITTIINLMVNHWSLLSSGKLWLCIILGLACIIMIPTLAVLLVQPKNGAVFPFMVPFVPLTPLLTISACVLLMLVLPVLAWIRYLFWMFVGLAFYFLYGVHHSNAKDVSPVHRLKIPKS